LVVETEITSAQKTTAKGTVDYERGGQKVSLSIDIVHPELWYPNGYGYHANQPVYPFHVKLQTGVHIQDEQTVRAGLRSVVLRREVDQWVRSFEFVVNSIPVVVKGADVIHFDSFPTRVTLPITAANSSQQRPLTLI
jgi:beta-mannosidase